MVLRITIGSIAVLLASGLALSAGQSGQFLEKESGVVDRIGAVPTPGETHPVLVRQRSVPERTVLINDIGTRLAPAAKAPSSVDQPPASVPANRYQIIVAPEGTLLLDSHSGSTWRLDLSDQKPIWKRIQRDSD